MHVKSMCKEIQVDGNQYVLESEWEDENGKCERK